LPGTISGTTNGSGVLARLSLTSGGDILTPVFSGGQEDTGDWLDPKMSMGRFRAYASGQSAECMGPFNTEVSLGLTQTWSVRSPTVGGPNSYVFCQFDLTVSNSVTGESSTTHVSIVGYNNGT
jgi:hypothetical protein